MSLIQVRFVLGSMVLASAAVTASALAEGAADQACIAHVAYLPLDVATVGKDDAGVAALGTYERISPDGRFVLRSYSGSLLGKVSLMELPARSAGPIKAYRTPFSNEAFPIQGSWRYLVDVTGEHYRFADVLRQQQRARPLFRGGMTGFYAAASEWAASTAASGAAAAERGAPQRLWLRSLSWPQNADPDQQGVGPLQVATLEVVDEGTSARIVAIHGPQFICSGRAPVDGNVYALPMLSVDGMEFSAIPQVPRDGQPTMRVYGLGSDPVVREHPCDLRADLGLSPGKAVFGFPRESGPPWLTYSDFGQVYVHDRGLKHTFRLDHVKHRVLASAFPGLTRDGRVIYGATWHDCPDTKACPQQAGYVVVDPHQSQAWRDYWKAQGKPSPKTCITQAEVLVERARFGRFHGLPE